VAANDPAIQPLGRVPDRVSSIESDVAIKNLIEGFTEPYADISMAAGEMGTLARVEVKDGDEVQAGQLIANLDDAVLRASLEVARAGMSATGDMQSATT
jgi:multidrug efflux pump subunit AcrA (membrane-fusion protein)